MSELPPTGHDHGYSAAVGRAHDLIVPNRSPGWMMAVTPASAASSMLSAKGKNASDASTLPAGSCPCCRAL